VQCQILHNGDFREFCTLLGDFMVINIRGFGMWARETRNSYNICGSKAIGS
jgi:hypothetical protein